jgi:hypothetical protein
LEVTVSITLPQELLTEMHAALGELLEHADEKGTHRLDLSGLASQVIEAWLASRRLRRASDAHEKAQWRRLECALDPRPVLDAEHRDSEPLAPEVIPDLGDLEVLADIA